MNWKNSVLPETTSPAPDFQSDRFPPLSTGVETLDDLLQGGIPRGKISEITGDPSSGKTGLATSIMRQATQNEEVVAYVDAFNSLDPYLVWKAGVELSQLLWVRCKSNSKIDPVQLALKAADILCQGGGAGAVVLDLSPVAFSPQHSIPSSNWFRLQRAISGTKTSIIVLTSGHSTCGASGLTLSLSRMQSEWSSSQKSIQDHQPSRDRIGREKRSKRRQAFFRGIQSQLTLSRGNYHGRVTLHSYFQP